MAGRGTLVTERPSTQVDERPVRLSRQILLVLALVVVALAIGLAVGLTSGDDVVTQDVPAADTDAVPAADTDAAPAADTDAVPYTGDWKDMLVGDGR